MVSDAPEARSCVRRKVLEARLYSCDPGLHPGEAVFERAESRLDHIESDLQCVEARAELIHPSRQADVRLGDDPDASLDLFEDHLEARGLCCRHERAILSSWSALSTSKAQAGFSRTEI